MILDHEKDTREYLLRQATQRGIVNPQAEVTPPKNKGEDFVAVLKDENGEEVLREKFKSTIC